MSITHVPVADTPDKINPYGQGEEPRVIFNPYEQLAKDEKAKPVDLLKRQQNILLRELYLISGLDLGSELKNNQPLKDILEIRKRMLRAACQCLEYSIRNSTYRPFDDTEAEVFANSGAITLPSGNEKLDVKIVTSSDGQDKPLSVNLRIDKDQRIDNLLTEHGTDHLELRPNVANLSKVSRRENHLRFFGKTSEVGFSVGALLRSGQQPDIMTMYVNRFENGAHTPFENVRFGDELRVRNPKPFRDGDFGIKTPESASVTGIVFAYLEAFRAQIRLAADPANVQARVEAYLSQLPPEMSRLAVSRGATANYRRM